MSSFHSEPLAWVDPYLLEVSAPRIAYIEGEDGDDGGKTGTDSGTNSCPFGQKRPKRGMSALNAGVLDCDDEAQRNIYNKFMMIHKARVSKSAHSKHGDVETLISPVDTQETPFLHFAANNVTFVGITGGKNAMIHFFDRMDFIPMHSLRLYGLAGVRDTGVLTSMGGGLGFAGKSAMESISLNLIKNSGGSLDAAPAVVDYKDPVLKLLLDPLGRQCVVIFHSGVSIVYSIRRNLSLSGATGDSSRSCSPSSNADSLHNDTKPIRNSLAITQKDIGVSNFIVESVGWNLDNTHEMTSDVVILGSRTGGVLCTARMGLVGVSDCRKLYQFPSTYTGPIQSVVQYQQSQGSLKYSVVLVTQCHRLFYFTSGNFSNGDASTVETAFLARNTSQGGSVASLAMVFDMFEGIDTLYNYISLPNTSTSQSSAHHHSFYATLKHSGGTVIPTNVNEVLISDLPTNSCVTLQLPKAPLSKQRERDILVEAAPQLDAAVRAANMLKSGYSPESDRYHSTKKAAPVCFCWNYGNWLVTGYITIGIWTKPKVRKIELPKKDADVKSDDEVFYGYDTKMGLQGLILSIDVNNMSHNNTITARKKMRNSVHEMSPSNSSNGKLTSQESNDSKPLNIVNVIDLALLLGSYEGMKAIFGGTVASTTLLDGNNKKTSSFGSVTSQLTRLSSHSFYFLDRIIFAKCSYFHLYIKTTRKLYVLAFPPFLKWEGANVLPKLLKNTAALVANMSNTIHTLSVSLSKIRKSASLSATSFNSIMSLSSSAACIGALAQNPKLLNSVVSNVVQSVSPDFQSNHSSIFGNEAASPDSSGGTKQGNNKTAVTLVNFYTAIQEHNVKSNNGGYTLTKRSDGSLDAESLLLAIATEVKNRMMGEFKMMSRSHQLQTVVMSEFNVLISVSPRSAAYSTQLISQGMQILTELEPQQQAERIKNLSAIDKSIGALVIANNMKQSALQSLLSSVVSGSGSAAGITAAVWNQSGSTKLCPESYTGYGGGSCAIESCDFYTFYMAKHCGKSFVKVTLPLHREHFANLIVAKPENDSSVRYFTQKNYATTVQKNVPTPLIMTDHKGKSCSIASQLQNLAATAKSAPRNSLYLIAMMIVSTPTCVCRIDPLFRSCYLLSLLPSRVSNVKSGVRASGMNMDDPYSDNDDGFVFEGGEDGLERSDKSTAILIAKASTRSKEILETLLPFLKLRYDYGEYLLFGEGLGNSRQLFCPLQAAVEMTQATGVSTTHHMRSQCNVESSSVVDGMSLYNYQMNSSLSFNDVILKLASFSEQSIAVLTVAIREKIALLSKTPQEILHRNSSKGRGLEGQDFNYGTEDCSESKNKHDKKPYASPELHCLSTIAMLMYLAGSAEEKHRHLISYRHLASCGTYSSHKAEDQVTEQVSTGIIGNQREKLISGRSGCVTNRRSISGGKNPDNKMKENNSIQSQKDESVKNDCSSLNYELMSQNELLCARKWGIENYDQSLQSFTYKHLHTIMWESLKGLLFSIGCETTLPFICTLMRRHNELLEYHILHNHYFEATVTMLEICGSSTNYSITSPHMRYIYDIIRKYPVRLLREEWARKGSNLKIDPLLLIPALLKYNLEHNESHRYATDSPFVLVEELKLKRLKRAIKEQVELQNGRIKAGCVPSFRKYGWGSRGSTNTTSTRASSDKKESESCDSLGNKVEPTIGDNQEDDQFALIAAEEIKRLRGMNIFFSHIPPVGGHSNRRFDEFQCPEHMGVTFLEHILEDDLRNTSKARKKRRSKAGVSGCVFRRDVGFSRINSKKGNMNRLEHQALHNLLLYFLASQGGGSDEDLVSFIECSEVLDKSYTLRVCMNNDRVAGAIQVYFDLGFLKDAVEQSLGIGNVELAKRMIRRINSETRGILHDDTGYNTRHELWQMVIKHVANQRDGARIALNLIGDSNGDVNVSHVLPHLSNTVMIREFQNELLTNVKNFGTLMNKVQRNIVQSTEEIENIREDLKREYMSFTSVNQNTKCIGCGQLVFSRQYIIFKGCGHVIHLSCLQQGVRNIEAARKTLSSQHCLYGDGHLRPPPNDELIQVGDVVASRIEQSLADEDEEGIDNNGIVSPVHVRGTSKSVYCFICHKHSVEAILQAPLSYDLLNTTTQNQGEDAEDSKVLDLDLS